MIVIFSFDGLEILVYLLPFNNRAISSVGLEHLVYTEGVGGSSPSSPTQNAKLLKISWGAFFVLGILEAGASAKNL